MPYHYGLMGRPLVQTNVSRSQGLGYLAFSLLNKLDNSDLNVQIHYSLADDHRFSGYCGFPPTIFRTDIPHNETVAKTQMGIFSIAKETKETGQHIRAVASDLAQESKDVLSDLSLHGKSTIDTLACESKSVLKSVSDQTSLIMQNLESSLKNMFGVGESAIKEAFIFCASQIAHLLANPSLKTLAICLGSLICRFSKDMTDKLGSVFDWCSEFVKQLLPSFERVQGAQVVAMTQAGEDDTFLITALSSLVGIFSGGIKFCVDRPPKSTLKYFASHFGDLTRNVSQTSVFLLQFLKQNMLVVAKIWNWLGLKKDPKAGFLYDLVNCNATLQRWASCVIELTDINRRDEVLSSAKKMRDVYICALVAQNLLCKMSLSTTSDARAVYVKGLCHQIVELQETIKADCLSPNAKFEPFVLWLSGKPGIGKSFMLEKECIELLKDVRYTTCGAPTYVRTVTNQYWNSIGNQPICIYDDVGVDSDSLKIQVAELFSLKTTTPYNPPIAELSNKKKRYNPIIVAMNSNHAFPRVDMFTPTAFYRRRDVLVDVKFQYSVEVEGVRKELCNVQELRQFEPLYETVLAEKRHLMFRFHSVPHDENSPWSEYMDYTAFSRELTSRFRTYYEREQLVYGRRLAEVGELFPEVDSGLPLDDFLSLLNEQLDLGIPNDENEFLRGAITGVTTQMGVEQITSKVASLLNVRKTPLKNFRSFPSDYVMHGICEHTAINFDYCFLRLCDADYAYLVTNLDADEDFKEEVKKNGLALKQCEGDCSLKYDDSWDYLASIFRDRHPPNTWAIKCEIPRFVEGYKLDLKYQPSPFKQSILTVTEKLQAYWAKVRPKWVKTVEVMWKAIKWLGAIVAVGALGTALYKRAEYSKKTNMCQAVEGIINGDNIYWNPDGSKRADAPEVPKNTLGFGAADVKTIVQDYKDDDGCVVFCGRASTAKDETASAQISASGDDRPVGVKTKSVRTLKEFVKNRKYVSAQFSLDVSIRNVLMKNMGKMSFLKGSTKLTNNYFALGGRTVVVTEHFWAAIAAEKRDVTIEMTRNNAILHVQSASCQVIMSEDDPLCYLTLPPHVNSFADICTHICTSEEIDAVPSSGEFIEKNGESLDVVSTPIRVIRGMPMLNEYSNKMENLGASFEHSSSRQGMCGALLLAKLGRWKIIGIHVAGTTGFNVKGYAAPICKDSLPAVQGTSVSQMELLEMDADKASVFIKSNVIELGLLPKNKVIHASC